MELFVCSSNYQLLNAIMIVQRNNIVAEILITRESLWYGCDLSVLTQKGIFKETYKWTVLLERLADEKIKKPSDKIKILTKKLITYLNKHAIWESLPNKDKRYEVVHVAYVDSLTLWIYTYFKSSGSKLSLFEDGTYSYGCLDVKKSHLRKFAELLLYRGSGIDECVQMYIKHPERVKLGSHSKVRLIKIDEHFDNRTITDIILPLYRTNPISISKFKRPVIIFDQNLELSEVKELQRGLVKKVVNIFGNEEVLLKLHPSSREINYGADITIFDEKLPFEVVMAYESMDKKLLVSIFSTACMSPKLDYNHEPFIIFTYRLYGDLFLIEDSYLEQIDQLRDTYVHKNRIAVPKNMTEFIQMVNLFRDEMR